MEESESGFLCFCAISFASGHTYQGIALGTKMPVSCALGWLDLVELALPSTSSLFGASDHLIEMSFENCLQTLK
jgi:hypothetical protein